MSIVWRVSQDDKSGLAATTVWYTNTVTGLKVHLHRTAGSEN
jgi:hypothetical protein